jgi:hypothetical protein
MEVGKGDTARLASAPGSLGMELRTAQRPARSAASREEGGGREGSGRRRRAEEGGALRGYLWFALIPWGNLKLSHSRHSSRLQRGQTLGLRAGARAARASAPPPSAHLCHRAARASQAATSDLSAPGTRGPQR